MNNIIIKDIPDHLATYSVGVLVGMGIEYQIDPESSLYKKVKEYRREKYLDIVAKGVTGDTLPAEVGYYISITGGDTDSIKASFRECTTR